MTTTRPKVDIDGIYNQKEAAKALGVDRSTLVRYAQQGVITFRIRKAGRRKVVTGSQIIKCWEKMY